MKRGICTVLAAVAVAMLAAAAIAGDEKKAEMKMDPAMLEAMTAAATPGEHHEHMKKLAGNFTYTNKMWMDPSMPPQESSGQRSGELILGGRYLVEKYSGSFMGMPFEGMGMLAYDNTAKQYVSTWIDNMGTGIMTSRGTCDPKGAWTMSGESPDPMTGKMMTMRSVTTLKDDNTIVMEMFCPGPDGNEYKMMEMTMVRAK